MRQSVEVKRVLNELKYMDDDKVFLTIGIDADGTIFEHSYPEIGKDLPLCVETLKRWQKEYKVGYILSTMRSGKSLDDVIKWFKERDIPLFGVQYHPTQHTWTDSNKVHCRYMLDDRNIGQPLTLDTRGIPCVDWAETARIFEPTLKASYNGMMEYIKNNKK